MHQVMTTQTLQQLTLSLLKWLRVNDGPILGENITAPEIIEALLVYTSGQQNNNGSRAVVTYPKNSPDSKPRLFIATTKNTVEFKVRNASVSAPFFAWWSRLE